jgi:hypothetical protein
MKVANLKIVQATWLHDCTVQDLMVSVLLRIPLEDKVDSGVRIPLPLLHLAGDHVRQQIPVSERNHVCLEESKCAVVLFDPLLLEGQELEIQERSKRKFLVGKQ